MDNLEHKHRGKIIFWDSGYGFIQQHDGSSIFFHKSAVLPENREKIELLSEVTYKLINVESGEHKGKINATEILIIKASNLAEHKRYVGTLTKWNNRSGFIESPQQQKTVSFYKTRSLIKPASYKDGDLVIFHQVKSSKDLNQLYALFAYPISMEKDIDFLQRQLVDSGIEEVKEYIGKLISERTDMPIGEKFEQELKILGFCDNQNNYFDLISKIKTYQKYNYEPNIELLKKYCENKYLIQLWETGIINGFDIEIIKPYFHTSKADSKRNVVLLLQGENRSEVLNYHFENLKEGGELNRLNNNLKTLLDIVYRNEESRELNIYKKVKNHVIQNLLPGELINLWLDGYIDNLPENFIIDNLDINNHKWIQTLFSKGNKFREPLEKIYENYFLNITKNNFEEELPQLVRRLLIFEEEYKERYQAISSVIRNILDDDKLFVLWVFGISIEFDPIRFFYKNHENINDFYKIKFFLHKDFETSKDKILSLLKQVKITQEGLLNFASYYKWNSLLTPTEIRPNREIDCFIPDIMTFVHNFDYNDIDIDSISQSIFDSLPKYQIHHVRLWLYGYVDKKLFDYFGFREIFKELTTEEQTLFKKNGELGYYYFNVIEAEKLEVKPCKNIISQNEISSIYSAVLTNIYFGNGYYMLRTEDKTYTGRKEEPFASSGFNRMPESSDFNKFEIEIEVSKKENRIISVKGIDVIFSLIHTGEIEKALGVIGDFENQLKKNRIKSYIEDKKLRRTIINYLNNHQCNKCEPEAVLEPKNFYRRMDENSGVDAKELTLLYSIKTKDGYGIIWENIDLTEDRATYIFKSKEDTHKRQLQIIADSIVSLAQLRSSLISSKEDAKLLDFKNNLGFIDSIRKQRGKIESFANWLNKLEKLLAKPIPAIPSLDEIDALKDWTPRIPHAPGNRKIPITPKPINQEGIQTSELDFVEGKRISINNLKKKKQNRMQILSSLKILNDTLSEHFKDHSIIK